MNANTARLLLVVLLFGFLATHGWVIAGYGPDRAATNTVAALSARSDVTAGAPPARFSVHRPLDAAVPDRFPRTRRASRAHAPLALGDSDAGGGLTASAPQLASVTPIRMSNGSPADDLVGDLAFTGPTNLGRGGVPFTDGPPAIGADPPLSSGPAFDSGGNPGGAPGGGNSGSTAIGGGSPSTTSDGGGNPNVKALPEPGSLALIAAGLGALALVRRRFRFAR